MTDKMFAPARDLKEGKYVLIDGVPCRIVEIEVSKPGKHGSAKMRVTGIGIFDNQKKTLLTPTDQDVEIPIIERKSVQILSIQGKVAQVMDKETFEIYDLDIPEEILSNAQAGKEAEIIQAMGKRKIERIK